MMPGRVLNQVKIVLGYAAVGRVGQFKSDK
jgi:hypothetical protein